MEPPHKGDLHTYPIYHIHFTLYTELDLCTKIDNQGSRNRASIPADSVLQPSFLLTPIFYFRHFVGYFRHKCSRSIEEEILPKSKVGFVN